MAAPTPVYFVCIDFKGYLKVRRYAFQEIHYISFNSINIIMLDNKLSKLRNKIDTLSKGGTMLAMFRTTNASPG